MNHPLFEYPENLPITQQKQRICETIERHQVVIISGETGSGKTTQLPKICLELGRGGVTGMIGHTQPRRLAAYRVAQRIADELKTPLGERVGYQMRFHQKINENTAIKLMTDGILLAEIQHDRLLMRYDTIIIDEAHERSLNIDFILGYLWQLLPKRPDLKIIITSATLDSQRFSDHFNQAPMIEVSGRSYPVEVRYRPPQKTNESELEGLQAMIDAVHELYRESTQGDILIFMSGEREIRDATEVLRQENISHTEILPLYSRLSYAEQKKNFQAHVGRRIVLATNVAETSLTVPSIKYVIDTGTARISRYSFRTKIQKLSLEPISQAAANQRKGRCGRISSGICIRLYEEQDFLSRPVFTDPEILRTNLSAVILQMMAFHLGDITSFPFIDLPDKRRIQDGIALLSELGAIEHSPKPNLTKIGRQLSRLPIDPRLGRMILAAQSRSCVQEVMIIAAALSIQDPRERPQDKKQAADEKHHRFSDKDSDFVAFIHLWNYIEEQQNALSVNQFRQLCHREFLNYMRVREWQDIYSQLKKSAQKSGLLTLSINHIEPHYFHVHTALLTGLLSHIGQKDMESHEFTGPRNIRFAIFPHSCLFKKPPKWIMVSELLETRRLWGHIAARIEPEWLEPLAGHLLKRHYSAPHWEKNKGAVIAHEKVTLFGLPIIYDRKINYGAIDPKLCRALFIRQALVEGEWETTHAFFHQNLKLLSEAEELENKSRRRDIVVDDHTLFEFYDERIGQEVVSSRHFNHWWKKVFQTDPDLLNFDKSMLITENAQEITEEDFPDFWSQEAFKLDLSYQFEPGNETDGVTVHIPLVMLNQIQAQGFDWQVPGMRFELITALLKSLPKKLRRHFVPVPNYAQAILESIRPLSGSFLSAIEKKLWHMSGVKITREDWQWHQVPEHLKITFRILDDQNQMIKEGKDLEVLRQSLTRQFKKTRSTLIEKCTFEKQDLKEWNFGTVPLYYESTQENYSIKHYPALVDETHSVALRLFETKQQQKIMMWKGLRRLLLLNMASPAQALRQKWFNKSKLGLYFNPYENIPALLEDCVACAVDKLMAEYGGLAWTQSEFLILKEKIRPKVYEVSEKITREVQQILDKAFSIHKKLQARCDLAQVAAFTDMRQQLEGLVCPYFISDNSLKPLADILRYLKAIERRLEKLPSQLQTDRSNMEKIHTLNDLWIKWKNQLTEWREKEKEIKEVRWMLEELRVSLFAQQLGTAYPISEKRVLNAMNKQING